MHGRKKVPLDEAKKIKQQKAIEFIRGEYEKVMDAQEHPEKIAALVEGKTPVLVQLDDFATLWNMRKKYFKEHATPEQLEIELQITQNVIESNPKAYWPFHHRRWCFEYLNITDLDKELALCEKLLNYDNRNFHAWRHRRWAAMRMGNKYEGELEFSKQCIEENFSNYSAWHYRSQLPNLTDYVAELDLVKTATWMDAKDQSAWIYYRWLLNRPSIMEDKECLQAEEANLDELKNEEPDCKYVYLALLWVQQKLDNTNEAKINELVSKLVELDPIREPYYRDLAKSS